MIILIAQILVLVALVVFALTGATAWVSGAGAALLILILLGYRAVAVPQKAVRNGMYLLREQDFSTRLRRVGQREADRIVDMFNTVMGTMRTERLRLLEQEHFLSLLIEASPTGIAVCDYDGRTVLRDNPAYRRLATSEVTEALEGLADGDSVTVRTGETDILRCSRHSFMDNGFPRPFYMVEPVTDEIRRAEKQMFNKIVRTVGHEVNNTVGGVASVLETLADIHAADPDIATVLDGCRGSCLNLAAFVRGYADVVKLPAPELHTLDMCAWLRSQQPFLAGMLPAHISLVVSVPGTPVVVQADAMLLERVLTNAVKNARESIADAPGRITVSVNPGVPAGACVCVTDNGPGISPEAARLLFTPFFSTKRPDRGLGLTLIAEILRAHRATFTLATDPVTKLTSLRFNIP